MPVLGVCWDPHLLQHQLDVLACPPPTAEIHALTGVLLICQFYCVMLTGGPYDCKSAAKKSIATGNWVQCTYYMPHNIG